MQAIQTKFLCPTNTKVDRIKAKCDRVEITVSWDYGLNVEKNHIAAIEALCKKFVDEDLKEYGEECRSPWGEEMYFGWISGGASLVGVFIGNS